MDTYTPETTWATPARPAPSQTKETHRIDLPLHLLGLSPPPCTVQMRIVRDGGSWVLIALTDPGKPADAARWLKGHGPARIEIAPGIAPRALRALFNALPELLVRHLSAVTVRHLVATPQGSASLFLEDTHDAIKAFVTAVRWGRDDIRVRNTLSGPDRAKLTARQLEIVSLAVASGYYEIPRKTDLRALARQAGVSLGAVSELLRRGESLIVMDYIDSFAEAQWHALGDFDDLWPEADGGATTETRDVTVLARTRLNSVPPSR